MLGMEIPPPPVLLERILVLPAGRLLVERLRDASGVYLVGGAVRDLLLGDRPVDLDLVAEDDVADVAARLGGARTVHDRFGTSTVSVAGHSYDLARARSESYSRPGALPDVRPAPLVEDLKRRDFTVNAIAIPLGGDRAGEVLAVPPALEDLKLRLLRVLHPASFRDDPTRLIRLVRYASRLGFGIEPETHRLAADAINDAALDTVSRPRIGNELKLLAGEHDPVDALGQARALGLDEAMHPRFGLHDPALARRALLLLGEQGRPDRLSLAAASSRIPAAELARLLDAMAFEAPDREAIVAAATRGEQLSELLAHAQCPSEIAEAVVGAPPELVALAGALGPEEHARQWLHRLSAVRLEIDGGDLLAAGVPEGPGVGRALRAALAAKLDGSVSSREEELAVALKAARERG